MAPWTTAPPLAPPAYPVPTAAPMPATVIAPTLGDLLMLTPGQFEDVTVEVLTAIGYKDAKRVGGSGDLGADVVCQDPQGRSTIVQCKRYAPGSNIGTPVIQTFIGMKNVHHRADRGIFVTTVTYSQPAIDLARQHGIALVGGADMLLLLHLTGVPLSPSSEAIASKEVRCPRCASENPVGDRFCLRCGEPLPQPVVPTPVAGTVAGQIAGAAPGVVQYVQCPRCKTMVPTTVRFCTNCGLQRTVPPSR